MISHTEKTSSWGSGIAEQGIGFVKYTLQRHLVKFEQEINRKGLADARALLRRFDRRPRARRFHQAQRRLPHRAGPCRRAVVDDGQQVRQLENLPPCQVATRCARPNPPPHRASRNEPPDQALLPTTAAAVASKPRRCRRNHGVRLTTSPPTTISVASAPSPSPRSWPPSPRR